MFPWKRLIGLLTSLSPPLCRDKTYQHCFINLQCWHSCEDAHTLTGSTWWTFLGKREKAIRARKGSGGTASETGKSDGQAPVFLYMKILLHLTCLRSPTNLNSQPVWTPVPEDTAGPRSGRAGIKGPDPPSHQWSAHPQSCTGALQHFCKKLWFDSCVPKHHQTGPCLRRRL